MARTHIHKYQTRYHAQVTYSRAIRARGDFVFMRGQVGALPDGALNGEGDPGAQADQACRNIDRWMEEAGTGLVRLLQFPIIGIILRGRTARVGLWERFPWQRGVIQLWIRFLMERTR